MKFLDTYLANLEQSSDVIHNDEKKEINSSMFTGGC